MTYTRRRKTLTETLRRVCECIGKIFIGMWCGFGIISIAIIAIVVSGGYYNHFKVEAEDYQKMYNEHHNIVEVDNYTEPSKGIGRFTD